MTESDAATIQTWLDEPDLLREHGRPDPVFTAAQVQEARLICATVEARYFTRH